MTLFPWLISILVSVLVLILGTAISAMATAPRDESKPSRQPAHERQWSSRFHPYLEIVPVPIGLLDRWGDPETRVMLLHAGLPWSVRAYVALRWVLLWLAVGFILILGIVNRWNLVSQFLGLVVLLTAYYGPHIWLRWRIDRRTTTIDLALPNFLERLALSMEAGLGFEIALRRITSNFPGLLGEDLRKFVRELDRGHTRSEALDHLVENSASSDLAAFVAAVKQSDRLGTSLARVLRIQTTILRTRRRRRAEEAGRRLPILIVFPLVFFFLPALLIIYLAPPILHLFLGR